jgi:hypothetical protein
MFRDTGKVAVERLKWVDGVEKDVVIIGES